MRNSFLYIFTLVCLTAFTFSLISCQSSEDLTPAQNTYKTLNGDGTRVWTIANTTKSGVVSTTPCDSVTAYTFNKDSTVSIRVDQSATCAISSINRYRYRVVTLANSGLTLYIKAPLGTNATDTILQYTLNSVSAKYVSSTYFTGTTVRTLNLKR